MKTKALLSLLALAGGMATTTTATAHGIWFAQRSGDLALIYGEGAEDLDTIKRQTKVQGIAAYNAIGAPVETALKPTDRLLLVDVRQQPAVVAGVLDNGYWSKGPDGKWVGKGKDEVPGAKESGRYYKYAVHLRAPLQAPLAALPGQTLQIVPVTTSLPKYKDQPLKLRVLYQGKPVANAQVLADFVNDPDAKPQRTGKDGSVTVTVRNQGLNVITALLDVAPEDAAKANKTEHLASLSFVLDHLPE